MRRLVIDCSIAAAWFFEDETSDLAEQVLNSLARLYGLTAYDAAYLELALREHLPLATLDGPLRNAASKAGVELVSVGS